MADLENKLQESKSARLRLIASDGVFSMDGTVAPLPNIIELAEKYDAITFVDDCHATGFFGKTGRYFKMQLFDFKSSCDYYNLILFHFIPTQRYRRIFWSSR